MARESIAHARELHTDDMPIDQRAVPEDLSDREGDVILVDPSIAKKAWLADLAFNEEPVTIRLEPSSDENAVQVFPCWVNGKGAEVFRNGRWEEIAYLPIGEVITVKRKYLEVIARAKVDTIRTPPMDASTEHPNNRPTRRTHAVNTFSVIEDRNPRGAAWLTEMMRRNY
jgi:hypothetical protein